MSQGIWGGNSFGRKNGHPGVRNSEFKVTAWHVEMCSR